MIYAINKYIVCFCWSLPMMMSITHRVIGVGLTLILPGNYPNYLDSIHSLSIGPFLIGMAKFCIVFPTSYHTYNGIQHLWWDIGKGFQIPEVYCTGYIVIGLSIVTSAALMFVCVCLSL
uniref:Succinate dehydrogenase cytochrome b560 subunit, mitochondrial n=1 Tax=Takifugu rubripes TaxID=31033 RepID=A0A3B5K2X7_TAKRU